MKLTTLLLIFLFSLNSISFSQELTQTEKLYATCKVWGYLKYYHPKAAAGKIDVDQQLFLILPKIAAANTKESFSEILISWIACMGKIKSRTKAEKHLYFNKNFNLDWTQDSHYFTKELSETLKRIEINRHQGNKHYVTYSQKGLGAAKMINETIIKNQSWEQVNSRLLCLFRYWNFIEYYFPYKYQTDQNWDDVLKLLIPKFLNAEKELDYHLAMLELIAAIDDSHGAFMTQKIFHHFGDKFVPFRTKIINDTAVVNYILDEDLAKENNIKIGDIIIAINGISIAEKLNQIQPFIGGSNNAVTNQRAHEFLFKGTQETCEVELLNGIKTIKRYPYKTFQKKKIPQQKIQELEPTIFYLNLGVINTNEIDSLLTKTTLAHALIIDLRNNAKGTMHSLINYISNKETDFYTAIYPDLNYPGKFIKKPGYKVGNKTDQYFKGKVILLVNESTQSHGEFTAMCLQTGNNVITVGSQTAGADGDITTFEMIEGNKTRCSGIGIFYSDGTEVQRKGVRIDVYAAETIEGITSGIDEQLEKALELARQ